MLGIAGALGVLVRDVVVDPDEAAAEELPLDAPDCALEDLTDLGCLQMAERLSDELGTLLVVRAVERDRVEVRVEPEVGRTALHGGDRSGLRAQDALLRAARSA